MLMLALWGAANAAPVELSHSGRLLDAAGAPVDGTHDLTVSLWTDASSQELADRLLLEEHPDLPVEAGYYQVLLGDDAPLDTGWLAGDVWVQVEVDGQVLGARQRLASAPRAAHVRGTVQLEDTDAPCGPASAGLLRYRAGAVELCTDSAWIPLGAARGLSATHPATRCSDVAANVTGVYFLDPDAGGASPTQAVLCDFDTPNGPWTVLQWDTSNNQQIGPRGTVSATASGWSLDYTSPSSFWNGVAVDGFYIEVIGGTKYVWQDVVLYGSTTRPNPAFLFTGAASDSWYCNSVTPSASTCRVTDRSTGRHWGRWVNTTGCCSVGRGTWYYSEHATLGNLNYGLCSHLYPNGPVATQGCAAGNHTTFASNGAGVFKFAIRY